MRYCRPNLNKFGGINWTQLVVKIFYKERI